MKLIDNLLNVKINMIFVNFNRNEIFFSFVNNALYY